MGEYQDAVISLDNPPSRYSPVLYVNGDTRSMRLFLLTDNAEGVLGRGSIKTGEYQDVNYSKSRKG